MKFDAATQKWVCDYCGSSFAQGELEYQTEEKSSNPGAVRQEKTDEPPLHGMEYTCPTCGAKIVTDENTSATFCFYCHNPTLISERLSKEFRPASVLPFQIDRETAEKNFLTWCRRRPFLPKKFTSRAQIEKMTGMYVPFWLFDCTVDGFVSGLGTTVRSWRSGDYRYTETTYFSVERGATMDFGRVPADGSAKIDDGMMKAIEPFCYEELKRFDMSYLSGFFSEKYDVDDKTSYSLVKQRLERYGEDVLRREMSGYTSVTVQNRKFNFERAKATYTLLPVWILTYRHDEKTYTFMMNGQTGKIAGQTPFSLAKAVRFGAIAWALLTVLLMLFGGL